MCEISGWRMSTQPASRKGRTSQREWRRSPRAMGMEVWLCKDVIPVMCSESKGSSMKSGWCGSRARASCLAMGLWMRPWKSMPASIPRSLTVLRRSTADWRTDGESSQPISSVAFIFTAWKPWALRTRLYETFSSAIISLLRDTYACSLTSFGRSPPIHAYTLSLSRNLPPSSW